MSAAHDPTELDWDLAGRYLADELPARDRAAFERWIAAEPARREELALVRRLWDDAAAIPAGARVDAMWSAVGARMRSADHEQTPRDRPVAGGHGHHRRPFAVLPVATGPRRGRIPTFVAAASALLALFGLAENQRRAGAPASDDVAPREFRTGPGQRATVQLIDGTRVELGVASTLLVPPFGAGARVVTLRGEAMFDVAHDAQHPFRVRAAGTVVEDLGTRFGVRAYAEDRDVRVVVTSGAVELQTPVAASPGAARRLVAGQLARFDSTGRVTVQANVDTARYLAWTDGRVLIRNETLRDAAIEIERWHDVRISIPDAAVARLRITVDMRLGSLQKTLDAVTVPLRLRYDVTEQVARIYR